MAGCKAYACTAGFESVCEALYMGKPCMMIPAHVEFRMWENHAEAHILAAIENVYWDFYQRKENTYMGSDFHWIGGDFNTSDSLCYSFL